MRAWFQDIPIQRKLMLVIFLTSVVAMLLMRGTFFTYEFLTFRQTTARQLSTLGEVIANNSTAALAFQNQDDAREILTALKADRYIVAAALYDRNGKLFATYPADLAAASLPAAPGADGYRFEPSHLAGFQPVVQGGKRLGTLYLEFETGTVTSEWLRLSLGIALAVIAVILGVTYALSHVLQRQISRPVLNLAQTARTVSENRDYSVRASKLGNDEVGQLTDAFNQMLAELEKINRELEQRVRDRTAQLAAAHADLGQHARQLEAANKELEAFSYSVSHDLRAPLRHINGFAGLLAKHAGAVLDEKSHRYLTTMAGAAHNMGRLIDDLLAFSRLSRSSLNVAELDHDALVAEVIQDGHYTDTSSAFAWDLSPLGRVRADGAMLRQVWVNLIGNAVKYSGKNPRPRVGIGCSTTGAQPGEQVFFVRDNGVGFDMTYANKLFGVFQRLHGATEFEGTGIGLANVRRIVTRHGGRTWAEGVVGEGATFFFSLPVSPVASPSNSA